MNRQYLYFKSVNTILDEYNAGELKHGDCSACVVGNLCKEAAEELQLNKWLWGSRFMTVSGEEQIVANPSQIINDTLVIQIRSRYSNSIINQAEQLIAATGYTKKELMRIEFAFETADKGANEKEWMLNGMCAALEILKDIHSTPEQQHTQNIEKVKTIHLKSSHYSLTT